jgi:hypothetical protein
VKIVTVVYVLSSLVLAGTLAGCKKTPDKASASDSMASGRPGSLDGPTRGDGGMMMGNGGGMSRVAGMTSAGAMDSLETGLRAMDMMTAAQLQAAFPAHQRAAGAMLSRMNADVQGMHMSPNMGWSATTDSLHRDVTGMAGMTGAQMHAAMPAYHARMTRLIGMHGQMMTGTKR